MKHYTNGIITVEVNDNEFSPQASNCSCGKIHPIRKNKILTGKIYKPEQRQFILGGWDSSAKKVQESDPWLGAYQTERAQTPWE